jgi:hypothetical protein
LQIKIKIVSYHTADSKPVKQEVNRTVILPPLVFPGDEINNLDGKAAGVIDDALSDPGNGLGGSFRLVTEDNEGRLVFGRLADAVNSAKALLLQFFSLFKIFN